MFETIGSVLTIVLWAVSILIFGGGLILCFSNIFSGNGWDKFWGILAVGLAVPTCIAVYNWLESIVWCLFFTGLVLGVVGNAASDEPTTQKQKPRQPGVIEQMADEYLEQQKLERTIEKAIRKSRE